MTFETEEKTESYSWSENSNRDFFHLEIENLQEQIDPEKNVVEWKDDYNGKKVFDYTDKKGQKREIVIWKENGTYLITVKKWTTKGWNSVIKGQQMIAQNLNDFNKKLGEILDKNIWKENRTPIPKTGKRVFESLNTILPIQNSWSVTDIVKTVELPNPEVKYTIVSSLEEFENSDNFFVKKINKDPNINWKFKDALKQWYSIRFLQPLETRNTPSLSVDEITKPKEIIDDKLKGKSFVSDPGHGSSDTGAIGLIPHETNPNEKVVVYESSLMMDLTYRVARELRAHGATVELTHYMNRRRIMDKKDLPPCSRSFDKQWKEVFQDIWNGNDQNLAWTFFDGSETCMIERSKILNSSQSNLFVSFHADMLMNWNKVDDQQKILSIKYDERQQNENSQKRAQELLDKGFWYDNETIENNVKKTVDNMKLYVLHPKKYPAILVECWNLSQKDQAFTLRDPNGREALAKSFVSSLLKTSFMSDNSVKK